MAAVSSEKGLRPYYGSEEVGGLLACARKTVAGQRDETFLIWLDSKGKEAARLTFGEVWEGAASVAGALHASGRASPGDRVLLCFAPGHVFYVAFWACLRSRLVAVPVYPPEPAREFFLSRDTHSYSSGMAPSIEKLGVVRSDCDATLCLCDDAVATLKKTRGLFFTWPSPLNWWNVQGLVAAATKSNPGKNNVVAGGGGAGLELDSAGPDDVLFLQYTSGSTGAPKGVIVTAGNLWHNINARRPSSTIN